MNTHNILKQIALLALISTVVVFAGCGDEAPPSDSTVASSDSAVSIAGSMPLTTKIPPELIEGTPQPIKVPNLEPVPSSAPVLMVPEGTQLLSTGKSVTSSDDLSLIHI